MRTFFPALFVLVAVCPIGWAGDAPAVGEDASSERLARSQFPLEAGESFAAELKQLEAVLAAKIAHPAPENFAYDRVYGHELNRVFELVECWPSEAFRKPLSDFYPSADICVIPCARALLNYNDPVLRRLVETRRDFTVSYFGGCSGGYSESVEHQLEMEVSYFDRFDSSETIIPPFREQMISPKIEWPKRITIPKAVQLLKDDELSIQLQSWLWLAEHGIVGPAHCVKRNWSILTYAQKWYVIRSVDLEKVVIGMVRFETLCDELYEIESGGLRDELWLLRGKMGNQAIRDRARQMVQAELQPGFDPERLKEGESQRALTLLSESPEPHDLAILLTLARSADESLHYEGLYGLCQIDEPAAIHEVGRCLLKPREVDYFILAYGLQKQAAKRLRYRDHYLIVFARALQTLPADDMFYSHLIDNFELMSGHEFGHNGLFLPGGVDEKIARETARKCQEWLLKNRRRL